MLSKDVELFTETDRVLARHFSPSAENVRLVNSAQLTTSLVQVGSGLPVNERNKILKNHTKINKQRHH